MTATLYIEAAHLDDSGMYRCTAFTTTGETMTEAVFFNFEVRSKEYLYSLVLEASPGQLALAKRLVNTGLEKKLLCWHCEEQCMSTLPFS